MAAERRCATVQVVVWQDLQDQKGENVKTHTTVTRLGKFQLTAFALALLANSGNAALAQDIMPLAAGAGAYRTAAETRVHPKAMQLQSNEYVIPELIIGGEWSSTIRLTNRGTQPIQTTNVYFADNAGNDLQATFQATDGSILTGTGFSFSLAVGGFAEATFIGGTTAFGSAIIDYCATAAGCAARGVYGEVTLTNHNATRPDFQSVFPFERPSALQYMLFDGRNGLTTVLYLVNENTSTSQVALDIVGPNNLILRTVSLTFASLSSQILTLHVLAPETIGIQGTLVIHGQNPSGLLITATALRINPSNSFTPLRSFVPAI